MFMFRQKSKPTPSAKKGIGRNPDKSASAPAHGRYKYNIPGISLAKALTPTALIPGNRGAETGGYQIGTKGRLVSPRRAKRPSSPLSPAKRSYSPPPPAQRPSLSPAPVNSDPPGTKAAQNSRDRHFPEVLDDLPAGVDPQGNPERPKRPTNDERSFFNALDNDSPNVDWIEKRAGDPYYRPINTTTRLRAAVGQRIGTIAATEDGQPCERCSRGLGPFASCKTVALKGRQKFGGACMNCTFSGAATRCTYRTSGSRPSSLGNVGTTVTRVNPSGAITKPHVGTPAPAVDKPVDAMKTNEEVKHLQTLVESLTKRLEATIKSIEDLREEQRNIRSLVDNRPSDRGWEEVPKLEETENVSNIKIPVPYAHEIISSSDSPLSSDDSSEWSSDDD